MLPSLDAQTDKNFVIYLITSDIMPEKYHEKLHSLTAGKDYIKVIRTGETDLNKVIEPILLGRTDLFQFRLDDDDAIASHYIKTVRENLKFIPPNGILTFPHGLVVFSEKGKIKIAPQYHRMLAIGLGRRHAIRNIYAMSHLRVDQNFPTLSLPMRGMYIHNLHTHNDTQANQAKFVENFLKSNRGAFLKDAQDRVDLELQKGFSWLKRDKLEKISRNLYEPLQ